MIRFPRPRIKLNFLSGKSKSKTKLGKGEHGFPIFGKATRKTSRRKRGWDNTGSYTGRV